MALELTQPLTEMSTRNISWGKGGLWVRLRTLPPSWNALGHYRPVTGLLYAFYISIISLYMFRVVLLLIIRRINSV
jgi:hypothetical protein